MVPCGRTDVTDVTKLLIVLRNFVKHDDDDDDDDDDNNNNNNNRCRFKRSTRKKKPVTRHFHIVLLLLLLLLLLLFNMYLLTCRLNSTSANKNNNNNNNRCSRQDGPSSNANVLCTGDTHLECQPGRCVSRRSQLNSRTAVHIQLQSLPSTTLPIHYLL